MCMGGGVCVCTCHVRVWGGISNRKRKGNVFSPCRKFHPCHGTLIFFDQKIVISELIGLLLDDRGLIWLWRNGLVTLIGWSGRETLSFLFGGGGGEEGQ